LPSSLSLAGVGGPIRHVSGLAGRFTAQNPTFASGDRMTPPARPFEDGTGIGELKRLPKLSVLIADDEAAIHTLCRDIVKHVVANAVVLSANDGMEAIAQARAHMPDVILMDLAMPGLDGLDAVKILKSSPDTAGIPIIAFTGHVWHTQAIVESECAALLAKPCTPRRMLATIADVLLRPDDSTRR
jgi:two-component system cell cycle response regulator DivK